MTITLSPEIEQRLRTRAERDWQDVNSLAEALIADALAEDADELTAEEIAEVRRGIRCGLQAVADGRERSVAALAAGGGVVGLGPVAAVPRLRSASEVTGR